MSIRRSDIVFFFAVLLGLYVAWLAQNVLLLIYVSALFAVVISPAIRLVRRIRIRSWRPSRGLAIGIVVTGMLVVLSLLIGFALPPIIRDTQAMATNWPTRIVSAAEKLKHIPMAGHIDAAALQEHLAAAAGGVVGILKGIAGGLFWLFSGIILTAYFILDGDRAFRWFVLLFPGKARDRLELTLLRAEARMRHWLIGQGALMLIFGLSSLLVFWLLRLKHFYALAVFAGLANIVPIVGPLVSVALAGTVAVLDSWTKLVGVLVFYLMYQQIENAFLTPRIMKTTVNLPPLAVIIALSLGGSLAGVLGALVAVPTAAVVAVFVDEYLVKPHSSSKLSVRAASTDLE